MNIAKYEMYVCAVEQGSLTKAAEQLGCSQPGMSHAIGSLEEELGFSLLLRGRSGTRPTPEGERILPYLRAILAADERLRQEVAAVHGLSVGTVRVGAFTSIAVHWLPGMIGEFQRAYPNIEFRLMNGDYADVEAWLEEGAVDMGFVSLPCSVAGCECIPLREDRVLAVLPKNHRLAGLSEFPLRELASEPFISLLKASDQDARRVMEQAGIRPHIKFTTKDDYAIIAMVEQGLGISIMPELVLRGRSENIRVMELEGHPSRTLALAVAPSPPPAVRKFAEVVCRWVKEDAKRLWLPETGSGV